MSLHPARLWIGLRGKKGNSVAARIASMQCANGGRRVRLTIHIISRGRDIRLLAPSLDIWRDIQ